ncbi:uncharacterized protein MONBRDRAFT_25365 [Monosiga brevicollis MX1]|uniref:Uncharacterized protein n=1 Tax=Monosiga brevicollis TaxID=81824 RepID=A9UZ73_MONBE|nr:uncharacterized protein MONBRDRAFT_25365 [Monosiga brevicollis MX1]EDQ89183.1 predicted protein [Monosiga brevicollis MX1]|eukprot:XP_001745759.1 hypothetical protein [Monosiga brevicollis MX1]
MATHLLREDGKGDLTDRMVIETAIRTCMRQSARHPPGFNPDHDPKWRSAYKVTTCCHRPAFLYLKAGLVDTEFFPQAIPKPVDESSQDRLNDALFFFFLVTCRRTDEAIDLFRRLPKYDRVGISAELCCPRTGLPALHLAAITDQAPLIPMFLAHGATVDGLASGQTALDICAKHLALDAMVELLKHMNTCEDGALLGIMRALLILCQRSQRGWTEKTVRGIQKVVPMMLKNNDFLRKPLYISLVEACSVANHTMVHTLLNCTDQFLMGSYADALGAYLESLQVEYHYFNMSRRQNEPPLDPSVHIANLYRMFMLNQNFVFPSVRVLEPSVLKMANMVYLRCVMERLYFTNTYVKSSALQNVHENLEIIDLQRRSEKAQAAASASLAREQERVLHRHQARILADTAEDAPAQASKSKKKKKKKKAATHD